VGSALLLTLREGLEAALIVAIVLAYLKRLGREQAFATVWLGTGAAVALSLIAGIIVFNVLGGLEGAAEEITEGVIAFTAAGVLTWMIFWMGRQARYIKGTLHAKVDAAVAAGSATALAGIAFVAVLREGLETALFLLSTGVGAESNAGQLVGGLIGLTVAAALGYLVYIGSRRVNLRVFFRVTGILILFFAAGLLSKGIHEFQEVAYIGSLNAHVWDVSSITVLNPDVSTSGEFLKGLFGWSPAPSIEMLIAYFAYLIPVGAAFLGMTRRMPAVVQKRTAEAGATA
jgi:high-affinity iron transporter